MTTPRKIIPDVPRKTVTGFRDEPDSHHRGHHRIFSLECGHEYVIARSLSRKQPEALPCNECWNGMMDKLFPNRSKRKRDEGAA
jgi:hypothetical protein